MGLRLKDILVGLSLLSDKRRFGIRFADINTLTYSHTKYLYNFMFVYHHDISIKVQRWEAMICTNHICLLFVLLYFSPGMQF